VSARGAQALAELRTTIRAITDVTADVVTGDVCRVWVRGWTWVAIYTALAGSVLHEGVSWRLYPGVLTAPGDVNGETRE
jgi:hypothetical protein